MCYRTGNLLA
jgi:bifunctional non-homologous end joining protein LigD